MKETDLTEGVAFYRDSNSGLVVKVEQDTSGTAWEDLEADEDVVCEKFYGSERKTQMYKKINVLAGYNCPYSAMDVSDGASADPAFVLIYPTDFKHYGSFSDDVKRDIERTIRRSEADIEDSKDKVFIVNVFSADMKHVLDEERVVWGFDNIIGGIDSFSVSENTLELIDLPELNNEL